MGPRYGHGLRGGHPEWHVGIDPAELVEQNDYFNSLIFINSVKKYTISLALRLSVDAESVVVWGRVMAMACVAVNVWEFRSSFIMIPQ